MDVLKQAVSAGSPITLRSREGVSIAALVPIERSITSFAFGLPTDLQRYLRITKAGKVDFNGGRSGPWTEFRTTTNEDGAICLQGVKSMAWLAVAEGQLTASDEPESLIPQFANEAIADDEGGADSPNIMLQMSEGGYMTSFPLRICKKRKHVLLTASSGNFACSPEGKFHRKGGEGKWAQWEMEVKAEGAAFRNVGHGAYLALHGNGFPVLADVPSLFSVGSIGMSPSESLPPVSRDVLSANDLAHFQQKGYVILRGAVSPELVRDGLRSINHQLGKPNCWAVDSNPLNASQLALKLPSEGVGGDIVNKSPIFWSALNVLLGEGNVAPWRQGQQIALRFPLAPEFGHCVPDVKKGTQYHIDGMGQNKLCPFSLLCGVALSDQSKPNCGNLHVFPGSHLNTDLHKYYLEKINDDTQGESDENKPDLGESLQVLLQPGDVVVAHQLLAHRIGANTSENIRYQLYYRVQHKNHRELKERIVHDPWIEFAI